jgi:glutamine amidotransferase/cyclase
LESFSAQFAALPGIAVPGGMAATEEISPKRPRVDDNDKEVVVLDYGAGNVQSVCNAIKHLGYSIRFVEKPEDIASAPRLVFPGVGAFGSAIAALKQRNFLEPLRRYLKEDKPYFGICLGMQTLFESSEESPGVEGLCILPGPVRRFPKDLGLAVPSIGWNGVAPMLQDSWPLADPPPRCYFVHSYRVPMPEGGRAPWALACSEYGERFICAVRHGNCVATQFHPEKSGSAGLALLKNWLSGSSPSPDIAKVSIVDAPVVPPPAKRVIACLDVRSDEHGDLVVTKGDQYDVRQDNAVRNLGKPVALAERYYEEGADEVAFLNITAFREVVLADQPMLALLNRAAEKIFVPLTIGGGIRSFVDPQGQKYDAVEVADAYFRAGADKVSIGTDAVHEAIAYYKSGRQLNGQSSLEQISKKYGCQAVVVSVDPVRVYVASAEDTSHATVAVGGEGATPAGPNGERFAWYCCTLKGGRERSDLDVVQLAMAVEALGAGEILLNCINRDGQNSGYELELIRQVKQACSLPVIASSGAGCVAHFADALRQPSAGGGGADAALAAGVFHRREVPIPSVKTFLNDEAGIHVRC